jgi:hypothetical protein
MTKLFTAALAVYALGALVIIAPAVHLITQVAARIPS